MGRIARRAAARLIDGGIAVLLLLVLWGVAFAMVGGDCEHAEECETPRIISVGALVAASLGTLAPFLYEVVSVRLRGATIGKAAVGLSVESKDNLVPNWWQALLRAVLFWALVPIPVIAILQASAPVSADIRWFILPVGVSLLASAVVFAAIRGNMIWDALAQTRVKHKPHRP